MSPNSAKDATERTVYSVSGITHHIKVALERRFVNLWVEGELSNVKRPSSGHLYFTLKDERAQLPAVMFRSAAQRLRFRPEDGTSVVVWGHINLYEPRGSYQLRIERMEPRGKGALQLAFEQLKRKLDEQGLFERERKKPLPLLPRRIGIVTSPSGAAIQDFCRVVHDRFPNLEVVVYPAQVQGDSAATEIAHGVRVLNQLGGFDVIVVTRGGGSLEDLWPFNEESVARAIASSAIPVVSAVGHEVDVTISDFVADKRAPTPSAAAEMVVQRKEAVRERVVLAGSRLDRALGSRLRDLSSALENRTMRRGLSSVQRGIERRSQRVDEASFRARHAIEQRKQERSRLLADLVKRLEAQRVDHKLRRASVSLTALSSRLDQAAQQLLARSAQALGTPAGKLDALSPLSVLARGYSLCWTAQGKLLRRATDASVGDPIRVDLHEGGLNCRVEGTRRRDHDDG